jgi:hypothetical protein
MDALPFLELLARELNKTGLEAILVGNAAAALQGAPVTTIDFDFLFRNTARNVAKVKTLAKALDATVARPFYPSSGMYRLTRVSDNLQVDLMTAIDGVRSFESLRAQSEKATFDGHPLLVASLKAIIESKRAAGRPQDMAVLGILEETLHEKEARKPEGTA